MDPATLAVGGILIVVGYVLGRITRRPHATAVQKCGCGHAYSFHDPVTGHCHHEYTGFTEGRTQQIQCTCRHYDGELPAHVIAGMVFPVSDQPSPSDGPG